MGISIFIKHAFSKHMLTMTTIEEQICILKIVDGLLKANKVGIKTRKDLERVKNFSLNTLKTECRKSWVVLRSKLKQAGLIHLLDDRRKDAEDIHR
jgi:hypothetical protein